MFSSEDVKGKVVSSNCRVAYGCVSYWKESSETELLGTAALYGPVVSTPYVSAWNIEGMRLDKEKIKCFEENRFQYHKKSHVDHCGIDSGLLR
jgi:hypothetical protein